MAKKKVPINEKVKTRKDEIRFKTDDPKRMLNKYICARVLKTWTEDFVDKDTGKITSVERNEVLFEKGTYIDREVLQKIQFFLTSLSLIHLVRQAIRMLPIQRTVSRHGIIW